MKKKNLWLFVLSTLTFGMVFSCGNPGSITSSDSASEKASINDTTTINDEDFVVDSDYEADLGSTITVEQVTVKDSEKKYHRSTIKVVDPDGIEVSLSSDNSFVVSKIGIYVVTHTINYGQNNAKSCSKSFKITVSDKSAPSLSEESFYRKENLVKLGDMVDLSKIEIVDNSGESITPSFKVTFNDTEVSLTNNTFIADQKGCYLVSVDATDSSGNKSDLTIKVFTVVDGEQGATLSNKYQGGVSLGDKGYNGEHSSNYHWTNEHPEWVNGTSLLADDCGIISSDAKYLSFWYYYDTKDYDARVTSISKYVYYETKAFDEYGNQVTEYWQFPNSYELNNNTWYRLVLDLTNATNIGADGGQCFNNPTNLKDIMFGFGFWDWSTNSNVTRSFDIYIDDIMLTSELPDDYHLPPVAESITLNETNLTLEVADVYNLVAEVGPDNVLDKSVSWTSSDPTVASVSNNGEVTALKQGTTTITATSISNPSVTSSCEVTVTASSAIEKKPDNSKAITIDHQYDIYGLQANNLGNEITTKTDLVDFAVGHGSYENYSIMNYVTSAGLCGVENPSLNDSGEPIENAVYQTWRFFFTDTDGIVYSVKAKQECYVKLSEPATPAGWLEGTTNYVVKRIDNTLDVIESRVLNGSNPSGTIACDYIHLDAGETFIWDIRSYGGIRNMQNSPDIVVAPVYIANESTEENNYQTMEEVTNALNAATKVNIDTTNGLKTYYLHNENASTSPNDSNDWTGHCGGNINFKGNGTVGTDELLYTIEAEGNGYLFLDIQNGAWNSMNLTLEISNGDNILSSKTLDLNNDDKISESMITYVHQGDIITIRYILNHTESSFDLAQLGFIKAEKAFIANPKIA